MPDATTPSSPTMPDAPTPAPALSLTWAERLIRDAQLPGLATAPALETSAFCRLQAAWQLPAGFEVRLRLEACRSDGEESYDLAISWPSGGGPVDRAQAQAELCLRVSQLGRLLADRLPPAARGGQQP